MLKLLYFVKRKPHMTHEQFRDHFEWSHAPMALKFFGHLFVEYRRNYVAQATFSEKSGRDQGTQPPWQWDLISEWILPNREALGEIYRLLYAPGIAKLFRADEERFIDLTSTVVV